MTTTAPAQTDRLPLAPLLVMALMGFVLIATETMPAGLLPQISNGLDLSQGTAGQLVSAYALGTVIAAIPLVSITKGMRRKPVFLIAVAGFLIANTVTAISPAVSLSLASRFAAGASSGLLWGMLAGYARRITPPGLAGRALAVASIGTPLGLAVGTPLGSWIGTTWDWRWSFGILSLLTVLVLTLAIIVVPDAPGQPAATRMPLTRVIVMPGVTVILAVILTWMLAHNLVYTYISSYLSASDINVSVDVALVVFGIAALAGIAITGFLVDRALRGLVLVSIGTFSIAAGALVLAQSPAALLLSIALWGASFGGAAAQLQTAMARASGDHVDVANSLLGVAFNVAIFGAGVLGAFLLQISDGSVLPPVMGALGLLTICIVLAARRSAFWQR